MGELIKRLKRFEGVRSCVYQDSRGFATIGIGFCIDKKVAGAGLQPIEIDFILKNRIAQIKGILNTYGFFSQLNPVRQEALIRMAFNLGIGGLFKFKKMIEALQEHEYDKAVEEARDSLWAKQIQQPRLDDICYCLANGKYQQLN